MAGKLIKYKKVGENLFFLSVNKFVDLGIPIIILPFLISKVGVYNYGIYAFATSIFTYLLNVTSYGFALSAVRDISQHRDDKKIINEIFSRVFSTKLFLVIISIVFIFLLISVFPDVNKYKVIYYYFILMLIADLFNTSWFFYGMEQMRFITIINAVSKSTFAILVLLFVREEDDFLEITFYQSIGYLLAGIGCIMLVLIKFNIKLKITRFTDVKNELIVGFSSFLNLVSPTLYSTFTIFIVGLFGNPIQVTIVTSAIRLSAIFTGVNTIMTNAFYPFIIRNRDKEQLVKKIFIYSGILFGVTLFILAEVILDLWIGNSITGKNFDDLVFITRILCFSPIFMAFVSAYGVNGLLVLKKDYLLSKITIASTLICVVVLFALVPYFSYYGAVIGVVLGRFFYGLLSYFYYKKEL